jgi:hypothetical protein
LLAGAREHDDTSSTRKKNRSCCKCLYSEDGCFICGEARRSFECVGVRVDDLGSLGWWRHPLNRHF